MNLQKLPVQEAYGDFTPSVNVRKVIQILLKYVPPEDLAHLQSIVLTSTATLSRRRKRQKTSSGASVPFVGGLYHHTWKDRPAYIEIFVDNILKNGSWYDLNIPMLRNWMFAKILYHEIGHHVQHMSKSKLVKREDYAEEYSTRLKRRFSQERYGRFRPLFNSFYGFIKKIGLVKFIEKRGL